MAQNTNISDCLIVVDMQNDFILKEGKLSINNTEEIINPIYSRIQEYITHQQTIINTQDWHPINHISFLSKTNKDGWPEHCVENTLGAEIIKPLKYFNWNLSVKKGIDKTCDAYSCFFNFKKLIENELIDFLKQNKIKTIEFAGVAADYCVYYSIVDALNLGYSCYLDLKCTQYIDVDNWSNKLSELTKKGLVVIDAKIS